MTADSTDLSFVVDASALLPLAVPENGSEEINRIFTFLGDGGKLNLHAPGLLYTECAHALMRYVRRDSLTAQEAIAAYQYFIQLPITLHDIPVLDLNQFKWALDNLVGSYDAIYVSLAKRLGIPLVTMDAKLIGKAGSYVQLMDLTQADTQIQALKRA